MAGGTGSSSFFIQQLCTEHLHCASQLDISWPRLVYILVRETSNNRAKLKLTRSFQRARSPVKKIQLENMPVTGAGRGRGPLAEDRRGPRPEW